MGPREPDTARPGGSDLATRRSLLATFVLLSLVALTWAAATPPFAGPDEPSHARKAAGVVRGELTDELDPRTGAAVVEGPAVLNNGADCFAFKATVTADCQVLVDGGGDTSMGHAARDYPPTYYVVTGTPTLVLDGIDLLYAQRSASGLAAAAVVTLAVASLRRSRDPRTALVGLAVALTPMAMFLFGVVNPSSLSIAAGVAAWAGGYHLARAAPSDRLAVPVAATAAPLCLLILVRRDAMVWGSLIGVGLLAVVPRHRLALLARARAVWVGVAAVALALVVQLVASGASSAGTFAENSQGVAEPELTPTWLLGRLQRGGEQAVGVLGWMDTWLHTPLYWLWGALILVVLAVGVWRGPRQVALVAVGVLAAAVGAWLALEYVRPLYVQARYLLPLAVGAPLLAACGAAEGRAVLRSARHARPPRRGMAPALAATVLALVGAVQVVAFWTNLRRYSVGVDGAWWFFGDAAWSPPPAPALALLAVNATAMGAVLVHWWRDARPVSWASGDVSAPAVGDAGHEPRRSHSSTSAASAPTVVDSP